MILRPLREGIFAFGKDKLKDYDQLLLVNDTNIGPMRDLTQVFQEMADKQLDFWGNFFWRRARRCY